MAPTVQKAVVIQQDGSVALREVSVPKPGPDEILVRVVAVAQNPADCQWRLLLLPLAIHLFMHVQIRSTVISSSSREGCIVRQARRSSRRVRLFGDRRGDRVKCPAWSARDRRARRRSRPGRSVVVPSLQPGTVTTAKQKNFGLSSCFFILRNPYFPGLQG